MPAGRASARSRKCSESRRRVAGAARRGSGTGSSPMLRASASRGAFSTSARPTRISPEPPSSIPGCCAAATSRKAPLDAPELSVQRLDPAPQQPAQAALARREQRGALERETEQPRARLGRGRARSEVREGADLGREERRERRLARSRRRRGARAGGGGPRAAAGRRAAGAGRGAAGARPAPRARAASLRAPRPPRRRARAPARAPPRAPPRFQATSSSMVETGSPTSRRAPGIDDLVGAGVRVETAAVDQRHAERAQAGREHPVSVAAGHQERLAQAGEGRQRGVFLEHEHALAAHAEPHRRDQARAARRPARRRPSGGCAGSRSRRARAGRASAGAERGADQQRRARRRPCASISPTR